MRISLRIVLGEMKKIWDIRLLLIIALVCAMFYSIFMSFGIEHFRTNHSGVESFDYARELTLQYGKTVTADEMDAFLEKSRADLKSQEAAYIESDPVFADMGIHSVADYEALEDKENRTEKEETFLWAAFLSEKYDYISFKFQALADMEDWYTNFADRRAKLLTTQVAEYSKAAKARIAQIIGDREYLAIMNSAARDNTNDYLLQLAILTLLATLILISPLVVSDRSSGVFLLQYCSKQGRVLLLKQYCAMLASAFLLTTALIVIFGLIYTRNGTFVFRNNGMDSFFSSFDAGMWFRMTYGGWILRCCAMIYALSLGAASIAFVFSRFSRNFVTMIMKLLPFLVVLVLYCTQTFNYAFGIRDKSSQIAAIQGIPGYEAILSILILIAGAALAVRITKREQRIDIL
jgi:hypothetical protein